MADGAESYTSRESVLEGVDNVMSGLRHEVPVVSRERRTQQREQQESDPHEVVTLAVYQAEGEK